MSTKKYVYYVFRATNYAETWRDADDIQRTDIGMYGSLKKAKKAAYDDINYVAIHIVKDESLVKNPKWKKCKDERYKNSLYFFDNIGSWSPTYFIQKREIK
ncbi:MAG: hypothetical protein II598_03435 [Elusimicrobia bacterium]|nr:hypothetical protein [Elusimicrobiota bacterium]